MKALTLTAPYGTLTALHVKRIETRSWSTQYRGPLAIHQAAGLKPVGGKIGLVDLCHTAPFFDVLDKAGHRGGRELPFGAIVAVVELASVISMELLHAAVESFGSYSWTGPSGRSYAYLLTDQERAFGDYSPGRYAWLLANVRALPEPIPCRGALGLWTVPADIAAQLA